MKLEIKRNLNLPLFLSIAFAFLFGGGIVYSIYELDGPFQPRNVSGLYAGIATVALGVFCAKVVIADLHYGTIYLLFTSARDRIKFLVSRVLVISTMSLLFGFGCAALLFVNHQLNGQAFSASDVGTSVLHYVLFGVFFTLLFQVISMYYQKVMQLLILSLVTILVLPGLLGIVFQVEAIPDFVKDLVAYAPVYSLPNQLPFLALDGVEMGVTAVVSLLLFVFAYERLPKIDY
jgi:ABC-2 type transport system permease protein